MMSWWSQLAPREHALILVGAGVALFAGVFQFILVPSMEFRSRAERSYAAEIALNAEVRAAQAGNEQSANAPTRAMPLQAVVSDTADVFGLALSRMTPSEGGLNMWLEAEPPAGLFTWLVDLERNHGVRVEKASIRWNQDQTTVNATLFVVREN